MKEFRELSRTSTNNENGVVPYSIELVNDNLNEWNIKVYQFDTDSQVSPTSFFSHPLRRSSILNGQQRDSQSRSLSTWVTLKLYQCYKWVSVRVLDVIPDILLISNAIH